MALANAGAKAGNPESPSTEQSSTNNGTQKSKKQRILYEIQIFLNFKGLSWTSF
jgi:hypothetical protein